MILLRLVANASVVEINCMKTTITRQGAIDAFAVSSVLQEMVKYVSAKTRIRSRVIRCDFFLAKCMDAVVTQNVEKKSDEESEKRILFTITITNNNNIITITSFYAQIVCSKDRPRKVQFPLNRGYLDNVERYHQESGATISEARHTYPWQYGGGNDQSIIEMNYSKYGI